MLDHSSLVNRPQPIYNLDVDALWKIFWMNTDMFASSSTTIDAPDTSSSDDWTVKTRLYPRISWGSELVARAANAPLCIKGSQQFCLQKWSEDLECCVFFKDLLDHHWPRIQKLEIWIDYDGWRDQETGHKFTIGPPWAPIHRPAPMLESFHLVSYQHRSGIQSDMLFDGSAPLLRSFELQFDSLDSVAKSITHAPWLSNLRSLVLKKEDDPAEILAVLSDTPLLENLTVQGPTTIWPRLRGEFATISLPKLRHLNFTGSLWDICGLLKCMRLSTTMCSLGLNIEDYLIDRSLNILNRMARQIFEFVQPYLSGRPMIHIKRLTISNHFFLMHIFPFGTDKCPGCDSGGITIQFREPDVRENSGGYTVAVILSSLFIPLLTSQPLTRTKIDKLEMENISSCSQEILAEDLLISENPVSVTRLQVPIRVLQLMMTTRVDVDKQSSHIQMLEPMNVLANERAPGVYLSFLKHQRERGKPISTLILPSRWYRPSHDVSPYEIRDWGILDEIHGLRIVWGEESASAGGEDNQSGGGEYICGSGAPETLDFGTKLLTL